MQCPNCGSTDYSNWTVNYEGQYGFRPKSVTDDKIVADVNRYAFASGTVVGVTCNDCGHSWYPEGVTFAEDF